MKRYIRWVMAVWVGSVSVLMAQDAKLAAASKDDTNPEFVQEQNPWQVSLGLLYKNWFYEHDALQQRGPSEGTKGNDWENGDTSGGGWGFQSRVARGDGRLNISFLKSDYQFHYVPDGGEQTIDTVSREFEVTWLQIRSRNEQAEWGTTIGFRYMGLQKHQKLTEAKKTAEGDGQMNWLMLMGGYEGNIRPFDTPTFQAHGSLNFFLAEARGDARTSGADTNWNDAVFSDTYSSAYSLGYGMRVVVGGDIEITKRVRLTVDYMREWLYSFDATGSGIVVFPDNYDALFIENHHAIVASLNYLF